MKWSQQTTAHRIRFLGFLILLLPGLVYVRKTSVHQTVDTFTPSPPPTSAPFISSPVNGENVQGIVEIRGSTAVDGFVSYIIDFSYSEDQTSTWFEIQTGNQPDSTGVLARWDTRQITDGDYRIRLRVFTTASETQAFVVDNIRVRNYTSLDTATPSPTVTLEPARLAPTTPAISPTATITPLASQTSLPMNPAEITSGQITSSLARGAIAVVALFAIFGFLIRLRRQ